MVEPDKTVHFDPELGTEYTITPQPPVGYNVVPGETVTGIVGSDPKDESTWHVTENVDNNYYYIFGSCGMTVTNSGGEIPWTGDMNNLLPWILMAMLSLCGMAMLIGKKRRKEN